MGLDGEDADALLLLRLDCDEDVNEKLRLDREDAEAALLLKLDGEDDAEVLPKVDAEADDPPGETKHQVNGDEKRWSGNVSDGGVGSVMAAFDVWGLERVEWGNLLLKRGRCLDL